MGNICCPYSFEVIEGLLVKKEARTKNQHKSLLIVGSGPVGMVAALMLKNHFNKVILLERQSQESFLRRHGFTFPIVFSYAAIQILERVGVWKGIESERSEFFGVVIHKRVLGREFEFESYREGVFSHWRNHIVAKLYERVLEENIDLHFEANVEDIDFQENVCVESRLGKIPFDLLLGADGIGSQTRTLMAKAHPEYSDEAFSLTLLDKWFAYRLPAKGALRQKFGGGDRFLASNVYVDNLAQYPSDKFRIITTSMKQPDEEISVLIKHGAAIDMQRLKMLNESFFGQYVDSVKELNEAWAEGYAGKFEQVKAPTFCLNSVLLVGDAAHGFESTGDLINMGITSISSLLEILDRNPRIPIALQEYDETVGESLRHYADFSLRRSEEKIAAEVAAFEVGARLGISSHHPSLFGIYEDDFEIRSYMDAYRKDLFKLKLFFFGLPVALPLLTRFFLKSGKQDANLIEKE